MKSNFRRFICRSYIKKKKNEENLENNSKEKGNLVLKASLIRTPFLLFIFFLREITKS